MRYGARELWARGCEGGQRSARACGLSSVGLLVLNKGNLGVLPAAAGGSASQSAAFSPSHPEPRQISQWSRALTIAIPKQQAADELKQMVTYKRDYFNSPW